MDITLPNGVIIENIPPNATADQIKNYAINSGAITAEEYGTFEPATGLDRDLQRVGNFLTDNIDTGSSIGGAVAGAAAGSVLGPVGTIVGGVAGGALGAFGGTLAEQEVKGEEIDVSKATEEAAMSAAIDVATFGAGKVLRPIAKALGVTPDSVLGRLLPTDAKDLKLGSLESRRQTQQILEEGGGTLSASQTGQASVLRKLGENISEQGILSGRQARQRTLKNAEILEQRAQQMIDDIDPSLAGSTDEVGMSIYNIISTGREAAFDVYDTQLTKIMSEYGTTPMSTKRMRDAIDNFLDENSASGIGTTLTDGTLAAIKDIKKLYEGKVLPLDSIMKAQKIVNREIRSAGQFGGGKFNTDVERELTELNNVLKDAVLATMKVRNPKLATDYTILNKTYGDTMNSLLPEINQNIVSAAGKQDYQTMGTLLMKATNISRVEAMMNSIDTAFKALSSAKPATLAKLNVKTPEQAKSIIRQSYLADFFGQAIEEGNIYKLSNVAKSLGRPTTEKKFKAILGDQYVPFKALMNAIAESGGKTGGSILGLALRSREAGIITGGQFQTSVAGEIYGKLGMAASVLGIPEILGRISTNRKAVKKLLALEEQFRKNPNLTPEFVTASIVKIIEDLPETDREDLRDFLQ